MTWLWIPITLGAALAQTVRNATQRHLTAELGTLGATLVRFLYGLPFAVLYLGLVVGLTGQAVPLMDLAFLGWTFIGGSTQIAATALLLRVLAMRNFAIGVAYSKTEVIQVALFGFLMLGDAIDVYVGASILFAAAGVILVSAPADGSSVVRGLGSPTALLGLLSGACFALSAVGYRGAALTLAPQAPALAAAVTLVVAQAMQTVMLGGYLLVREPKVVRSVLTAWRVSLLAGFMGAFASGCWFTAMALVPVAQVRTLGLVELYFSYAVSRRIFRETLSTRELLGIALLAVGIFGVTLTR